MRRLASLVALVMALAACAAADIRSPTTTTSTTVGSPAPSTSAAPTTTSAPTTTTRPPGPPVGWLAPNGVPLAVTLASGDEVEVLTPCGDPLTITNGSPIYEVDAMLDPGHGGPIDTGAVGSNGLEEKEINLKVSLAAQAILEERGIATAVTRSADYPIPIRTRVEYAEAMEARVLVSIHHNAPAAPASGVPGVEIFVQSDSTESQRLGGLLYDETVAALSQFDIEWDRSPDAGVMTVLNPDGVDAYGMVRLPEIPSALLELGYIANHDEAVLYRTPEYVPAAATAVADAVETFLSSDETGAGLVEGRIFRPNRGVGQDQCVDVDLENDLYPDVIGVEVRQGTETLSFEATISSPYDTPDRYADAFRIVGDDGIVYGVRELVHDHANEQPFTRSLGGVEIPETVQSVTIEARDQVYGWGGETVEIDLP